MRRIDAHDDQGSEPPPNSRGFTNGLREPKDRKGEQASRRLVGRINGLTNGRTNGIVNGFINGLTNGSGQTNGLRVSSGERKVAASFTALRTRLATVAILCLFILALPYALVYTFPPDDVEIDGYFLDWLDAQIFEDTPETLNHDTAIMEYAMKLGSSESYFYLRTAGDVLTGVNGGADGYYVFIDIDGDAATGYSVRGLGADSLIVVIGWNHSVKLGELYFYDDRVGADDYAGFLLSGAPLVGHRDDRLEIGTNIALDSQSRAVLCTRSTDLSEDWTDVSFCAEGSAIRVAESHPSASVTAGSTDELILTLKLTVKGPPVTITALNFEPLGNATASSLEALESYRSLGTGDADAIEFEDALTLREGHSTTIDILATFSSDHLSDTYGLRLDRTSGFVADSDVSVTFDPAPMGYPIVHIASVPQGISVDGAFADWRRMPSELDWIGDVVYPSDEVPPNDDVDITATKAVSQGERAYFYMAVDGTMMAGSSIPGEIGRWADEVPWTDGGEVPGGEALPKLGANLAYVFIDTDYDSETGSYIGGAEASIVIAGKHNAILSARAYEFLGSGWAYVCDVDAALDAYQLEIGATLDALGLLSGSSYAAMFISQDWRGCEDSAVSFLFSDGLTGLREFGGVIINEVFSSVPGLPDDWFELYNTGTETIDLGGWEMWVNGVLEYTFPGGATIDPGEILLIEGIDIGRATSFVLIDDSGVVIDSVVLPFWKAETYGRTGTPEDEYAVWDWTEPTPGEINTGQVPIPEFGGAAIPVAAITIMFLVITQRRRRAATRRATNSESRGRTE